MLRRLSGFVILGWAAFASIGAAAGSAVVDQTGKFTIKGSVTFEKEPALPKDSRLIVELRHLPELPNAPAVANQTFDLADKQSPISFEVAAERYRLVAGGTYVARAVIRLGTAALWTAGDVKVDIRESTVDVKEIALKPAK